MRAPLVSRRLRTMSAPAVVRNCVVFMPMLPGFEAARAAVARGVHDSGAIMLRLEEYMVDAEWQRWLVHTVRRASVVLADVTDHNPFVMYELGLAHARQLPTLLIVDTRNERVSATVLGTPFLPYDVDHLPGFESRLATALARLTTGVTFTPSYAHARALTDDFSAATGLAVPTVSRDEFATRIEVAIDRGDLPLDGPGEALYLLARVVENADDVGVMRALWEWSASADARRS
jgi:hypothetical protein